MNVSDLLSSGYLPSELPPPFTSDTFGRAADALQQALPSLDSLRWARAVRFNLARHGTLRRRLSIPNPLHHLKLSQIISEHWLAISARIDRSTLSQSRPTHVPGSAPPIRPKMPLRMLPELRARTRVGKRYRLRTDISRFYPSIYTHSLEWAMHGKRASKTALAAKTPLPPPGRDLDRAVQQGQDGQTIGIPIGPTTSLILAELVLSEVDNNLKARAGSLDGFRYIDDYELAFASFGEAESALNLLQDELAAMELQLNARKTSIARLPEALDSSWSAQLRGMTFRPGARNQRRDLLRLFDKMVSLSEEAPEGNVFKFALGVLQHGVEVEPANWDLVQHWLMQCMAAEPGTLRPVLGELLRYAKHSNATVDRGLLSDALHQLMIDHIPRGHSSEVAWAIWGLIEFGISIDEAAAERIITMDDPIVSLLALMSNELGCWPRAVDFAPLARWMTHDALYGSHWLLAYEAMRRGWLPPATSADALSGDRYFSVLERHGVTFTDSQRRLVLAPLPLAPPPLPSGA